MSPRTPPRLHIRMPPTRARPRSPAAKPGLSPPYRGLPSAATRPEASPDPRRCRADDDLDEGARGTGLKKCSRNASGSRLPGESIESTATCVAREHRVGGVFGATAAPSLSSMSSETASGPSRRCADPRITVTVNRLSTARRRRLRLGSITDAGCRRGHPAETRPAPSGRGASPSPTTTSRRDMKSVRAAAPCAPPYNPAHIRRSSSLLLSVGGRSCVVDELIRLRH